MTAAGARGATLTEMSRVLHVDTMTDAHGGFGELLASVPDTLEVEEPYGPAGEPNARANFVHAPGEAPVEINAWVERQARRRIQHLLRPPDINEATRLILTNALHFKASWLHRFRRETTRDEDFAAPKTPARAPMMRPQVAYFPHAKMDDLALAELPYVESSISMIVIPPDGGYSLDDIESRIGREYETWVGALSAGRVDLWLPRWNRHGSPSPKS